MREDTKKLLYSLYRRHLESECRLEEAQNKLLEAMQKVEEEGPSAKANLEVWGTRILQELTAVNAQVALMAWAQTKMLAEMRDALERLCSEADKAQELPGFDN